MNDKYQKKAKVSERLERFFERTFNYAGLFLMGSILLRFAPYTSLANLATTGIIVSGGVLATSVIGEFACSTLKDHYENKSENLKSNQSTASIQRAETSRSNTLSRVESYDDYRVNERCYGNDEIFTRSKPTVRQRRRGK